MIKDIFVGALRDYERNPFQGAIGVLGLAVALAAAILTGLFIRDELSFDRFVPGVENVYVATSTVTSPGRADMRSDVTPRGLAERLKTDFSEIEAAARLAYDRAVVSNGQLESREDIAWVDADFFRVLPLPVVAGDAAQALRDPTAVVITRSVARKFFGQDAPLGRSLEVGAAGPLRVAAVLEDLPATTHLTQQIFASGASPASLLNQMDTSRFPQAFYPWVQTRHPGETPEFRLVTVRLRTYVRLAGDAESVLRELPAFSKRTEFRLPSTSRYTFDLLPLRELHLSPVVGGNLGAGDARTSRGILFGLGAMASAVLAMAIVNFINLKTARAAERGVEVGVRKACGARRGSLALRFVGEAIVQTAVAVLIALGLAEVVLPWLNDFLGRDMRLDYWRSLAATGGLILGILAVGVLAGVYPAFVLSSFRPADGLKGTTPGGGSSVVRQGLVVLQFALMAVLIVAVLVVSRQTRFAMEEGLRLDTDQMLLVKVTPCRGAFAEEVARLNGVRGAACSSEQLLGLSQSEIAGHIEAEVQGGEPVRLTDALVDYGFFELYGIRPMAGRLFARSNPADELPPVEPSERTGTVVINESAARRFGFSSPEEALNKIVTSEDLEDDRYQIVGVVPDFTVDLMNEAVRPTLYKVDFGFYPLDHVLSVKLQGDRIPETLQAIDAAWRRTGGQGPIQRQFLDDYVQTIHTATLRQMFLVSVLCALAVLLGTLGLLALAAFTAQQRTKEIGVRKALGASTADILRLLMWGFTKPVLIANLIGLPIAFLVMSHWLGGFSYRISLTPLYFAAAGLLSLAIAWATVLGHALGVARSRPVNALRHE